MPEVRTSLEDDFCPGHDFFRTRDFCNNHFSVLEAKFFYFVHWFLLLCWLGYALWMLCVFVPACEKAVESGGEQAAAPAGEQVGAAGDVEMAAAPEDVQIEET